LARQSIERSLQITAAKRRRFVKQAHDMIELGQEPARKKRLQYGACFRQPHPRFCVYRCPVHLIGRGIEHRLYTQSRLVPEVVDEAQFSQAIPPRLLGPSARLSSGEAPVADPVEREKAHAAPDDENDDARIHLVRASLRSNRKTRPKTNHAKVAQGLRKTVQ
jgi:hypothetical protein